MIKRVIKRDGRVKTFDVDLIRKAISKAYEEIYSDNSITFEREYGNIYSKLVPKLNEMGEEVGIEQIQDVVVEVLKDVNKTVGDSYQDYRLKRSREREMKTTTMQKVDSILKGNNILNSNANVDEHSFGGRKFESAGVIMKQYALNCLMAPEVAKAHINNKIYQHDLDSYAIGYHNCSFPDIKKLINENGFETRNGDVRPASGLATAFQQIAVIFQIQSQEQYGGVASCHLDYDLEEQVNISFRKAWCEVLYILNDEEVNHKDLPKMINIENLTNLKMINPVVCNKAFKLLNAEGLQASQGLYHNLNTLNDSGALHGNM